MNQSRRSVKMYFLVAFAICSMALSVVTSAQGAPPAGPIPQTLFGMHTNNLPDWPSVPFGAFRLWDIGVNWSKLCPTSSTCNFAPLDKVIAKAQAAGIPEVLYTFGHTPTWASSKPTDSSCFGVGAGDPGGCDPPVDLNADGTGTDQTFKDFVTAIANHAGTQIKYWEIWNEPTSPGQWLGTTKQLIRMAQDASQIIKAANPNAIILSPCPVGPHQAATWMDGFLSGGGGQYVDIISFHSYVNAGIAEQVITGGATMHAVMAKYGQQNKPLWSSEAGWSWNTNVSTEALQAAFLVRYYVLHWSSGIERLYWYAWDNPSLGTLWNSTGGLRPAGTAYQVVQNWMVGAVMPESCTVNSSTYTCPLTRSGAYQAQIVFNPNSTLTYTAPSQYIQYRDIQGNTHPVPANRVVTIGPAPIMLETNTPGTTNPPPSAVLSVTPTIGTAPLAVSASSTGSSDVNGSIVSTSTTFGDGSVAESGAPAGHTYTSAGTYLVTLKVTATGGSTSSATQAVTVSAATVPVAGLSVTPQTGTAPLLVTASSSSYETSGSIASQTIDFGDGSAASTTASATHTYKALGTYTVTLTVKDAKGVSSTATKAVSVSAAGIPVAALTVTPVTGTGPLTITADSSASSEAGGSIASQTIHWGDKTMQATTARATHIYKVAGQYTVTLMVTDAKGVSATATKAVSVSAPIPVAALAVTPMAGTGPLTITANSSSYEVGGSIASQTINWGDKTTAATTARATHIYKTVGQYTVTLAVKDASGNVAHVSKAVQVSK